MEQVSMNGVQNVQYNAPKVASEPSFQGRAPEMKEDGNNKLLGALAGLGAIGLGSVLVFRDLKKGDGSALRKIGKNITKKSPNNNIKKGTQEAIEHSKKIVKNVSAEVQEKTNKLTNNVSDLISQQKTYEQLETKIDLSEKAIKSAERLKKTEVTINGKTMKIDKAKGHVSNWKGEIKKLNPVSDEQIAKAKKEVENFAKTPEGKSILDMQRTARKHPELSEKALAQIANTPAATTSEASKLSEKYNNYVSKMKAKGKDPLSFLDYQTKLSKLGTFK